MKTLNKTKLYFFLLLLGIGLTTLPTSHAAKKAAPAPAASPDAGDTSSEGETVDVSKITEKYWAQGKDTELGVVQNRKYTSEHKFELEAFAGILSTDPFLSVHSIGGSIGYHFSQYLSLHAVAWKAAVSPSDAYRAFEAQAASTATLNTNPPKSFYGLQGNFNFLYGKASLFGHAIIYVDLFILGGLGVTDTSTGNDITPFIGIGQKIHLNRYMALDLDYRIMHFNESVNNNGVMQGRSNNTDAINLGISFFI